MKYLPASRDVVLLALGLFFSQQIWAAYPLIVGPASPKPMESVQLLVVVPSYKFLATRPNVSMAGNKITVVAEFITMLHVGGQPGVRGISVGLGQLPAGAYTVEFLESAASTSVDTAQFTVASPAARIADYPGHNFSDLWWNPAESGWGMSIHVKNDNLFAAWFVYDQAGKAQWYSFQAGSWSTAPASTNNPPSDISYIYTGKVVKTTGPSFGGIDPLAANIAITEAGTATLRFNSYDSAVFSGTVEGRTFSKNLVRQVF